jgi:hypothetical protein
MPRYLPLPKDERRYFGEKISREASFYTNLIADSCGAREIVNDLCVNFVSIVGENRAFGARFEHECLREFCGMQ